MEGAYNQVPSIPDPFHGDQLAMFAAFGIGDLEGVEGATDRVVTLSERSTVVCPLHELRLVPDACPSCRVLVRESAA
jgi:hypothetical protein